MDRDMLTEAIDTLADHFGHIHGRVGSSQSPQVPDPRSNRWKNELDTFEHWWKMIWKRRLQKFPEGQFTFTTEHGPPPYQPYFFKEDDVGILSHVEEVNAWLGKRAQAKFREIYTQS